MDIVGKKKKKWNCSISVFRERDCIVLQKAIKEEVYRRNANIKMFHITYSVHCTRGSLLVIKDYTTFEQMSKFRTFTKTSSNVATALILDETDLATSGKEKGDGIEDKEKKT